ncbi:MAG TPA: protein phosphatase 2C domain-containing protein [Propionibacteriaceae bacterium]|nr:protein phosphatase 2C domain-containing protein [Propionibacteriaceae bacterium]
MTEGDGVPAPAESGLAAGPTISFGFNLGKIPDQGEDSDPILRDGPDLGLIGVFDGMGGAGGTVYETPDGRRSGAYLASRIARDVVERRMLDLLEPDWNLKGEAAAEDLRRSVQDALQERLAELKAPPSQLRSRLLRALPTTMAVVALQRTHRDKATWACHVFWAGDSRAYAFLPTGARQLSTDDLRDPSDAMTNLYRDSVVSNAMSADTDFVVNYRRVELKAPFLLCCATDGCFGYVPSPMHFEHLVLAPLPSARSVDAWSRAIQTKVAAVTGDDAAMAMMGVGADRSGFQSLFAPRVAELEEQYIAPFDESSRAVAEAERELEAARQRHLELTGERWSAYQPDYERHLKPDAPVDDEYADDDPAAGEHPDEESEPAEEKVKS